MPPKKSTKRKAGSAVPDASLAYPSVKPADGEPLTRWDLQWDALQLIFGDTTYQFTPPSYPNPNSPLYPTDRSWTFAELYLDCLVNSSKATRNLRDKLAESATFGQNFAKLAFLVNVGRINTTLAFYPEMKTALRTFHPVPAMMTHSYTAGSLQDAPRMKSQLKGCAIPQEANGSDNMPAGVNVLIQRSTEYGWKPTTCVVQLIFMLYTEHAVIARKYLPEGFSIYDILYPTDPTNSLPSAQRAKAFLWLVNRFLETPEQIIADFADPAAKLPAEELPQLQRRDCSSENVDPPEEVALGEKMHRDRQIFNEKTEKLKEEAQHSAAGSRPMSPIPLLAPPTPAEANAPHPMQGGTIRTPSQTRKKRTRSIASQDAGYSTPGSRPGSPLPNNDMHAFATPYEAVNPLDRNQSPMNPFAVMPPAKAPEPAFTDSDSFLQIALKRLRRDVAMNRDPVYDSDDDLDMAPHELAARLLCAGAR